jgi:centrosomal protein CEP76
MSAVSPRSASKKRLDELKSMLDEQLQSTQMYDKLRQMLVEHVQHDTTTTATTDSKHNSSSSSSSPDHDHDLLQDIIARLKSYRANAPSLDIERCVRPGKVYLHVRLRGGKGFTLNSIDDELQSAEPSYVGELELYLQFGSQRFCSKRVSAAVEPAFDDEFLIDLLEDMPTGDNSVTIHIERLVKLNRPLHLLLLKRLPHGETEVVSSHKLEWRPVVIWGDQTTTVELVGGEADCKMPVGMIQMDLRLLPSPPGVELDDKDRTMLVEEEYLTDQLARDHAVELQIEQRFRLYAKAWWKDYQQSHPTFASRLIKMFALSEYGVRKFVSTFVQPLKCGRYLDSPLHAARFVRQITYERDLDIGGDRTEIWNSLHSIVCKRVGDVEDHATLLCSLLLGFGLDAYVCIGTNQVGPHVWVMTRRSTAGTAGHSPSDGNAYTAVFWDPVKGTQHDMSERRRNIALQQPAASTEPLINSVWADLLPFRSIHCVFNHKSFYANCQPYDDVLSCNWVLEDESQWKPMSTEAIGVLPRRSAIELGAGLAPPDYRPHRQSTPATDRVADEEAFELELRQMIHQFRREELKVDTQFDSDFSYILSSALSTYEFERVSGQTFGTAEFQESMKNHIPLNYIFKGFPFQFNHCDAVRALNFMMQSNSGACDDLLRTRGHNVQFGVRVRMFEYPEHTRAVWVMLAVKYQESD